MLIRNYTLRFVTPAFLGNAEQDGQWRTPPIKALLRQWWRVAYAADQRDQRRPIDVAAMRHTEGMLFGMVADGDGESCKSRLRIRLARWNKGCMSSWNGQESERVVHPEVKGRDGRPAPVGAQLYLGYGPLTSAQGQTALKARAAVQAGEDAVLSLAFPAGPDGKRLDAALSLLHSFGTLGGRSRNGWGSFALAAADTATPAFDTAVVSKVIFPWEEALKLDWPHAIGRDKRGPLVWRTEEALPDWKAVMRRLAEIKIGLRTQFVFPNSPPPHRQPLARHWLSYPITRHATSAWDRNARLPNSLRFKVRADPDGKLCGVVFHVPCLPPPEFRPDRQAICAVWNRVHEFLDESAQRLQRIAS